MPDTAQKPMSDTGQESISRDLTEEVLAAFFARLRENPKCALEMVDALEVVAQVGSGLQDPSSVLKALKDSLKNST